MPFGQDAALAGLPTLVFIGINRRGRNVAGAGRWAVEALRGPSLRVTDCADIRCRHGATGIARMHAVSAHTALVRRRRLVTPRSGPGVAIPAPCRPASPGRREALEGYDVDERWTLWEKVLALVAALLAATVVLLLALVVLPRLTTPDVPLADVSSTPAATAPATTPLATAPVATQETAPAAASGAQSLEALRLRIIDTWTSVTKLSQDIELDFQAGDYTSGARDAKTMSKLASDELKWLRDNLADPCYQSVWSYWRSSIADVGTAAGLASAFYEGLAGTGPADIADMQAKLQTSIRTMTSLTNELPAAQARC